MARLPRIVAPGYPHHVIQRGNRRQRVFFSSNDKQTYIRLLHEHSLQFGIQILAYCLMDNHVHLVVIPEHEDSLAKGIGETHREYTGMINSREGWKGYLWQGRFLSYPLDREYLYIVIGYVERNPVRARMVERAEEYPWSSARAHIYGKGDTLLSNKPFITEISDWKSYLEGNEESKKLAGIFQKHAVTGRPLGNDRFIDELEILTGRVLKKKKPGRKKQNMDN